MIKWTFNKLFKIVFKLIVLAVVLLAIASALIFEFSVHKSSALHISKFSPIANFVDKVNDVKEDVEEKGATEAMATQYSGFVASKEDEDWYSSGEDVYILSDDSLKLHGKLLMNKKSSNVYVIACHGYSNDASEMAGFARKFNGMGYNVLTPDARAYGESEGKVIGMGWLERLDICKWVDYIIKQNSDAKIILYGISMGGSTVMMAAGENLPSNVVAVVEDCGYTSVWDEFSWEAKSVVDNEKIPVEPIVFTASIASKLMGGYSYSEASALEQVKKSNTPILFIHGDKDTFVPYQMVDTLYNAATCEKEKLIVKGAGHAMSSEVDSKLYWSTIENFIGKYL